MLYEKELVVCNYRPDSMGPDFHCIYPSIIARPTIFIFHADHIYIQLFLFIIPGLIIGLLLFEVGNIKNPKVRSKSFWAVIIILVLFVVDWRIFY
ncbi:hypothetical protein FJZ18_03375 [Candidatus Pacearchaeota archaeon]|nr:hypothetical protein [Candidatus Pacearchaeota archaeon]